MKKKEVLSNRKCKKCRSSMTYIRFRENVRVCRSCGYIEKLNKNGGKNV